MARIKLEDTVQDVLVKMSDGNPGAISCMMAILQEHDKIDPQAFMGGLGAILLFDTYEIYGTNIYILFSDKCGRDVRKMLMLMRATQLGYFSHLRLREMASDQMREINLTDTEWKELDDKVCETLKEFTRKPNENPA